MSKKSKKSANTNIDALIYKPEGKKAVETIAKRRKSKLSIKDDAVTKEKKVELFDLSKMSSVLDDMEDFVKEGKYGKALTVANDNRKVVDEFLDAYQGDAAVEDSKAFSGMVKKFITLCKSYYEYDEKQRELIDNINYDGLLARYLAEGNVEPTGIVPKGMKNLKKVPITYPDLHNNVDKAYVLREDDTVPDGVKESDSVEAFLKRIYKTLGIPHSAEISLELSSKIDGVSINGTISGDVLMNPQTRGDESESVSVIGMSDMEVSIGHVSDNRFGIQYEAFITEEDRVAASEYLKLARPYVSCRHAAAGIVHRLCTMEDDDLLQFISLYPIAAEGLDGTYEEQMDYISNFGIIPEDMPKRKVITGDMKDLIKSIEKQYNKLIELREDLSFAIDGMVITVVNDEYRNKLGREHRTNKFQIALKFDPATAIATVSGITLDSGKKGYRTIQVVLENPVYLDGVKYDHIPVLSYDLFEKLGLRRGSRVNVHRVGDVIPAISVVSDGNGKKLEAPATCPNCGGHLVVKNKKLFCDNMQCPGNIVGKFTHFFEAVGLEGYSDSFSEILMTKMNCKSIGDVMNLTDDDFKANEVTGALADKFVNALHAAVKGKRDYIILGALGLPGVGTEKAKLILAKKSFSDLKTLYTKKYDTGYLTCGLGINTNRILLMNMLESKNFHNDIVVLEEYVTPTTDFGKLVKIGHTGGKLSDKVLRICKANNFEVVDGATFDILITASRASESTKMERAKKKNLPIFLEEDFIDQYGYAIDEEDDED